MIVHCPSCSTGFHLAPGIVAGAALRCSRCRVAFPCPAHRRAYALGPATLPPPRAVAVPSPSAIPSILEPISEPIVEAAPPTQVAAIVRAPQPPRPSAPSRGSWQLEPAVASRSASLVPLALAAAGAAGAWLAAPAVPASWTASLPFATERWMVSAAGAVAGLVLSGVGLAWRAARR